MSLINEMLRDLAERRGPTAVALLHGVQPAAGIAHRPTRTTSLALLTLAGVAGLLLAWGWTIGGRTALRAPPVHPTVAASKPASAPPAPRVGRTPPARARAVIRDVQVRDGVRGTRLELDLDRPAAYRARASAGGHRVIVHLNHERWRGPLPPLPPRAPNLIGLERQAANDGYTLTLRFRHPMTLADTALEPGTAGGQRLVVRATPRPEPLRAPPPPPAAHVPARAAHSGAASVVVTRSLPASAAQRAARRYQQAVSAVRGGDVAGAESALQQALALAPGLRGARELLATLLIRSGRGADAMALLGPSAHEHPKDIPLVLLYARVLVEEGHLPKARRVLEAALPEGAQDPDFDALLGMVYQRMGAHRQAVDTYRAALVLKPLDSNLWAGLGIALEGAGDSPAARDAYQRALDTGGMAPALARYVTARLGALR
ncbi:MAG: tetratricopeptide repeat protein [Gammaproteobacteria bacterium]